MTMYDSTGKEVFINWSNSTHGIYTDPYGTSMQVIELCSRSQIDLIILSSLTLLVMIVIWKYQKYFKSNTLSWLRMIAAVIGIGCLFIASTRIGL